jgi:hypothetical protein
MHIVAGRSQIPAGAFHEDGLVAPAEDMSEELGEGSNYNFSLFNLLRGGFFAQIQFVVQALPTPHVQPAGDLPDF